jgi:hypothetical protein
LRSAVPLQTVSGDGAAFFHAIRLFAPSWWAGLLNNIGICP